MALIRRSNERSVGRSPYGDVSSWEPFRVMRDLMRWDPFQEMEPVLGRERGFNPRFDVKETGNSYVFKADLPGIKESDLDISLTGNQLRISGERSEEKVEESDRSYLSEVSYGSFSRSFTLPEGCDSEHVSAELKDGVLTLMLPKKPEVQPKRISISSSGEHAGKGRA